MNTKFLLSPAYLCSAALLILGAVLSSGRFMLVGWIFFIIGLFLNALVLVVLVNRDQLTQIGAQLKRPDASDIEIGEPVVQRLEHPAEGMDEAEPEVSQNQDADPQAAAATRDAVAVKESAAAKRT